MSAFCEACGGEEVISRFYANESAKAVRYALEKCACVGGPSLRFGDGPRNDERSVGEEEYKRLKVAFSPSLPDNLPFQAAA